MKTTKPILGLMGLALGSVSPVLCGEDLSLSGGQSFGLRPGNKVHMGPGGGSPIIVPGGSGGYGPETFNQVQLGLALQLLDDLTRSLQRRDDQARREIEENQRRIRAAGDEAVREGKNAAQQALNNLDALDRAENAGSKRPSKSKRPDLEFGNYRPGIDKIIGYVGSTPLYGLEGWDNETGGPVDQALNSALNNTPSQGPQSDTFGSAANDLPNQFPSSADGQVQTVSKPGMSGPTGYMNQAPGSGGQSLDSALNGGPPNPDGKPSVYDQAMDYYRAYDLKMHGGFQNPADPTPPGSFIGQYNKEINHLDDQMKQMQADRDALIDSRPPKPSVGDNPWKETNGALERSGGWMYVHIDDLVNGMVKDAEGAAMNYLKSTANYGKYWGSFDGMYDTLGGKQQLIDAYDATINDLKQRQDILADQRRTIQAGAQANDRVLDERMATFEREHPGLVNDVQEKWWRDHPKGR